MSTRWRLCFLGVWAIFSFHATTVSAQAEPSQPASAEAAFGRFGAPAEVTAPDDPPTTPAAPPATPSFEGKKPKPPRFGDAGQFVLIGGSQIGIGTSSYSNSDAGSFGVSFEPALDYFIVRDVSVGIELGFSHGKSSGYVSTGLSTTEYTHLGAGLHIGVNVPVTNGISVYPTFSVGFHHVTSTGVAPATPAEGAPEATSTPSTGSRRRTSSQPHPKAPRRSHGASETPVRSF